MESFQASWKEESLEFQKEEFYESIRAPKWIDFTAPDSAEEPDDRAWFCIQAGCDQKHETALQQTSHHSYLLKFQGSKSVNHNMTRLPEMENKPRSKARRASLSAPTLKGKDRTPGKVKPYFMSAGKIRQKQCSENENPNSTPEINIANLELKMKMDVTDDAEGFSTPNQLSNSADDMEASQNSPTHVFTGTPMDDAATNAIHSNPKHGKNRITKPMGAFSTPRIKKCSVKPEPFRSIHSSSKRSNAATSMSTTRGRTTVVKSMVFQTPRKTPAKSPSKDLTSLTKVCADLKKLEVSGEINHVPGHFCRSSRCAANDPNYSSPASVPTKKLLSARSLQPNQATETPLLKSHPKTKEDAPSSSKPKDSRTVLIHPPASHRRALFSEQDIENENLPGISAQTLDLEHNKVEISSENDSCETQVQYLSEKSNLEEFFQTLQINAPVPLKGEKQQDSKLAIEDVEVSGFDVLGNELKKNRDKSFYIKDIPAVGGLMKNPMPISHEQTGTDGQKLVEFKSEGIENNLIETECSKSGGEEQVAVCDKHWRLRVIETNSNKGAESSDSEKPISEQDENDMPNNVFERLQQCSESLPKEGECIMKNNSEGEAENAFSEDGQNDAQNYFHGEPGKTNTEKRSSEALVDSDTEDKRAVDKTAIEIQFVLEAECEVRDVERKADEILKMDFYSEPDNRVVEERTNEFLEGYDGENRGAIEESAINIQHFSEAECGESGTEKIATGILRHFDVRNKQAPEDRTNKDQLESDAEPDYREAAEGKVDEVVQVQSNAKPENKLPIEDSNVNYQEHLQLQITAEVKVQNFEEDERDLMQGINKNESETDSHNNVHFCCPNGMSNSSQYFAQNLGNVGKSLLDSESETITNSGTHSGAAQEHWEELKSSLLQVNFSDSRPELDKGNLSPQHRENEDNKSDVEGSVETVKEPNSLQLEGSNGAIFCLDIGPDCNEISSIPQSECNKTSHCLVYQNLNSEVDSDMGLDCHENFRRPQPKAHYLGSEETSSKQSSSDIILQEKVIPVAFCTINIADDTTADRGSILGLDSESCTTKSIRTLRHEEMGGEDTSQSPKHVHMGSESGEGDLFTSAKGKKRSSNDMNSMINCSKGDLCQDESCQSSGKVNSNSLAAQTSQDNGTSVVKHKKPKTTCPKPFRLRTEERGVFKEASLNKKIEESIADKGNIPVFSVSSMGVNKTQHKGKYPRVEPSKPKKAKSEAITQTKSLKLDKDKMNKVKPKQIEIPKSVKLEDNEEMKNALVKTVHHPLKMPFFGQPFKPQRSTKKLTIPKEPNFHPIHPKKDCTKALTSDLGHCKKQWID